MNLRRNLRCVLYGLVLIVVSSIAWLFAKLGDRLLNMIEGIEAEIIAKDVPCPRCGGCELEQINEPTESHGTPIFHLICRSCSYPWASDHPSAILVPQAEGLILILEAREEARQREERAG